MENSGYLYQQTTDDFYEVPLASPTLQPEDVLVAVKAVSVNPVDTKLATVTSQEPRILGYDSVGEIVAVGRSVTHFDVGEQVYYAGTTQRSGANQRLQAVDQRIIAKAPKTLTDGEAAALPLTSLTAWELLFEKMGLTPAAGANQGQILLINGAGGVGSIAAQLARWSGLVVSATSSPQNADWLKANGVAHCLDYHQDLVAQAGEGAFDYIVSLYDVTDYLSTVAKLIKPFGKVGTIVETKAPLEMNLLKNLSVDFFWEYMFTKTDFQVALPSQGRILQQVADLVTAGTLQTTLAKELTGGVTAANLTTAHRIVRQGHFGKVVVSGGFH